MKTQTKKTENVGVSPESYRLVIEREGNRVVSTPWKKHTMWIVRLATSFGPFRRFNLAHLGTL
jgi:hypothetical protein